nr:hypothetical protein [Tanacetum cinerariifolium]
GSAIPETTSDELTATVPDTKVLSKAEKSKKQKSSTSEATLSQDAKRTRSATTHAASGSSKKNLFNESSDDDDEVRKVGKQNDEQDDDCAEIPFMAPIPFKGNKGKENFSSSAVKGARTKDTMDGCVTLPPGMSVIIRFEDRKVG